MVEINPVFLLKHIVIFLFPGFLNERGTDNSTTLDVNGYIYDIDGE